VRAVLPGIYIIVSVVVQKNAKKVPWGDGGRG
jgi:hypothetical protein